jgi:hypothetical protein
MRALSFTPCHELIGIGRTQSKLPTVVLRQVNDLWLAIPFDPVTEREYAEQRLFRLDGDGWRFMRQSATATFHIMLCSLAASSLPIEKFNIFNSRRLDRAVVWLVMNLVTWVSHTKDLPLLLHLRSHCQSAFKTGLSSIQFRHRTIL